MANKKYQISGLKETMNAIRKLPPKFQGGKVVRPIFRQGLRKFIKPEMVRNAPRDTDNLVNNIKIKNDRSRHDAVTLYVKNDAFYALFIEKGTSVRMIKGRGKYGYGVTRGRMKRKPFFYPAIYNNADQYINFTSKNFGKLAEKYLNRASKGIIKKLGK